VEVSSTGITAEEHGKPIDRRAQAVLREHAYDVPRREAPQVRAPDLTAHGLVLAMPSLHARALRRLAKTPDVADRVVMYRSFDPEAPAVPPGQPEHPLDIDYPWYGGMEDFEVCLAQVEAAADPIVEHVRSELAERGLTSA